MHDGLGVVGVGQLVLEVVAAADSVIAAKTHTNNLYNRMNEVTGEAQYSHFVVGPDLALDVVEVHDDVLVAVGPGVLVAAAEGVEELVDDGVAGLDRNFNRSCGIQKKRYIS